MGRLDLPDNPKYVSNNDRVKNQEDLLAEIQKWLDGFNSVEEPLEIMHREGVPCAPVNDIAGAVTDPQLRARDMLVPVENPLGGTFLMQNVPYRLSEAVARVGEHSASLGEHTREILSRVLEYSESEIRALKEGGVTYEE
jgi:crotonobetainyl-CoA:carnitine CoA-transferase CaiB-like acyl-CoA transferase